MCTIWRKVRIILFLHFFVYWLIYPYLSLWFILFICFILFYFILFCIFLFYFSTMFYYCFSSNIDIWFIIRQFISEVLPKIIDTEKKYRFAEPYSDLKKLYCLFRRKGLELDLIYAPKLWKAVFENWSYFADKVRLTPSSQPGSNLFSFCLSDFLSFFLSFMSHLV